MTTYYSMRIWTKKSTTEFCFDLVGFCVDHGLDLANFNNYGLDGASYRIDIRSTTQMPFGLQTALAKRWDKWDILKIDVEKWNEPEDVKKGHDVGSKLALRFKELQREQKFHEANMIFLVALMFEKRWGKMFIPYWIKEFDESKLRKALEFVTDGVNVPWNPAVIERAIHTFLNNLGYGMGYTEQVFNTLMKWWWFAQLERGHDWKTNT